MCLSPHLSTAAVYYTVYMIEKGRQVRFTRESEWVKTCSVCTRQDTSIVYTKVIKANMV